MDTPETSPKNPKWRRRPDARPEEIIDAAHAMFAERGYAETRLEDVARKAGVSKGTVYLYFDSKETLFREMVRARKVPIIQAGEELVRTHTGSARELLIALIRRFWQSVRSEDMARMSRLVHSELGHFPELARFYFDEVVLRSRRLLIQTLERGIAAGEFRPVNTRFVARTIPLTLVQFAQHRCLFSAFDPDTPTDEEVLEGALDLILNGLLPRAAGATKD